MGPLRKNLSDGPYTGFNNWLNYLQKDYFQDDKICSFSVWTPLKSVLCPSTGYLLSVLWHQTLLSLKFLCWAWRNTQHRTLLQGRCSEWCGELQKKKDSQVFSPLAERRWEERGTGGLGKQRTRVRRAKKRLRMVCVRMRDSVATEVSATFVFINNSVHTPVALYIFQQPQTWKIFTLGLQSFSVAAGQTGSCERADFRVNPAHSVLPSVISANRPADCSAGFIWLIPKAPYLTSCDSTWQIATGPSHADVCWCFLSTLSFGRWVSCQLFS